MLSTSFFPATGQKPLKAGTWVATRGADPRFHISGHKGPLFATQQT